MTRFARGSRVFFIEEPIVNGAEPRLDVSERPEGVKVVVPHFPADLPRSEWDAVQEKLISNFVREQSIERYVLWFYTPMALGYTGGLSKPLAVVYDCMDELSAFNGASPELRAREMELFSLADLVYTGGQSLYEAKRERHPAVYAFPSSVDIPHFAQARQELEEPADQAGIPHPRIGFYGVVDERFDIGLIAGVADARPDWQIVILGPIVKIDPAILPKNANIHYLGGKDYKDLPRYIAGWDVAMLPFARNEATRFISPTKTPEYLAAGKPVVSTSIRDVVRPYGERGFVRIADDPESFVDAVEAALEEDAAERQRSVDAFLAQMSWDQTWSRMARLIDEAIDAKASHEKKAIIAATA
jgi:UDP-galactopyranose mutase